MVEQVKPQANSRFNAFRAKLQGKSAPRESPNDAAGDNGDSPAVGMLGIAKIGHGKPPQGCEGPTLAEPQPSPFERRYFIDPKQEILGEVSPSLLNPFQGTHCIVQECLNLKTKEKMAAKVIRSDDPETFICTEKEFQILRALDGHPNIIQGYDYVPEPDRSRAFLVMQKVDGFSILDMATEHGGPFEGNYSIV